MGDNEVELFLNHLVNQQNVAPNTQTQALNALSNTAYWQLSLTVILNNIDQSEQARFILLKRNDALLRLMDGFN